MGGIFSDKIKNTKLGQFDYIVTGDPDLLVLKNFRGIKIVKAKEFLEMI